MAESDDLRFLRIVLVLVGVIFVAGICPLMLIWPAGWTWHTGHSDYPLTIIGVVRNLGSFFDHRIAGPTRKSQPHLVHRMVESCSRRDHGDPIVRRT